ncbi:MAG: M23 family metallopeptidase [Clostridia bacterium]|nr:M23 family metallopeptidase [Clostridia bacterium]
MNELSALSSDSLLLEELIKLKENDMTQVENEIKDVLASLDNVNQDINDFGYNNWFWPGDDKYITSYYGGREVEGSKNYHKGIDINLRYEKVYAARAGTVITAKYSNSYGYYIVIDHGNNIQTLYAHLSKLDVKAGQKVSARELIGVSGNTGWSTGPHLHFEIRVNGSHVNPLKAKSVGITGMSSYLNLPD